MDEVIDLVSNDEEDRQPLSCRKRKRKKIIDNDEVNLTSDANGDASTSKAFNVTTDSGSEDISSEDSDSESGEDDDESASSSGDASTITESDSEESSDDSTGSEDEVMSWDEFNYLGEGNSNDTFVSPEVEEEHLKERFSEAMRLLFNENSHQQGFDSLTALLEEPLIASQRVSDLSTFDWNKAKSEYIRSCEPKLKMLAFGINRALARFAEPCIDFYLQALALRPVDKALWYEFGCAAAKAREWKTAEMAFHECQSDPNAVMKLATIYFYAKEYHKCIPLLKQILDCQPQNIAALVLKTEIAKLSTFWKLFVEFFFPTNPLLLPLPELPKEVSQKVLSEMAAFTNDNEAESARTFESNFSVHPLPSDSVKIAMDRTSEDFAKFICDYFDQSIAQQIPFGQQIHFTRDKRHNSLAQAHEASVSDFECLAYEESSCSSNASNEYDDIGESVRETVDDVIVVVEVVQQLVHDVDMLLTSKQRTTKKPKKNRRNLFLDVRRSTRNADDVPLEALESPVNVRPVNNSFITLQSVLGLPEGANPALNFPGASGHALENYTVKLTSPYHLDTFNGYLTIVLNQCEMTLEELLYSYLTFFATSLPAGCVMTENERKFYLEIYIRWESTFCRPFQQCCYAASTKDIAVHVVALELDPTNLTAAKAACKLIFENPFGFKQAFDVLMTNSDVEMVPSTTETDTTLRGLRKRAVSLLEEIDPPMAAKVKATLVAARIANRAVTREHHLNLAIGNVAFSNPYYRPVAQPTTTAAKNKSNATASIVEVTSLSNESIPLNTSDGDKVAATFEKVRASTSTLSSVNFAEFLPLWLELSNALKEHRKKHATVTMVPAESCESLISIDDSPMSEDQLLDLLADVAKGRDSPIESSTFSNRVEMFSNNVDLGLLMTEYMKRLTEFVKTIKKDGLSVFDKLEWFDFVDETRRVVAAMQMASSNDEVFEHGLLSLDNELQNTLVARYLWLQYIRKERDDNPKPLLAALIYLLEVNTPIYTQLADVKPADRIITAVTVSRLLTDIFRMEKTIKIQKLFEAGKYDDFISTLTTDFNWNCCTTAELIANLRLLLSAFHTVGDSQGAIIYLCRMLDKIIVSRDVDADRDALYVDCLTQLNALDFTTIDKASVEAVARCLLVCTEYNRFNQNITLWKVLYKLVSAFEPEYDDDSRLELFKEIEGFPRAMPTRALCVLSECHYVLTNGQCTQNDGEFLQFTVDEIYRVCGKTPLSDVILSCSIGKTIQKNCEAQVLQCVRCLIDKNTARNSLFDHGACVEAKPTVDLAYKVISILLRQLPMFDDVLKATVDTTDTICRIFSFIETVQPAGLSEAMEAFINHLKLPPFFLFTTGEGTKLKPQGDLTNSFTWPCVPITEEVKQLAYLRYALLVLRYRRSKGDDLETIWKLAKECLVLVGPPEREVLPIRFIHSLWAIYAVASTSAFSSLNDSELLIKFPMQFYLFKMAFLLWPRGFQLHLDAVNIYYHVHARINRYIRVTMKRGSKEEQEALAALDREKIFDQSQLHLDTFRHKIAITDEYPCDISWLEAYFSGKIAEKRKQHSKVVLEHYYRCAMQMRVEKYNYPLRIRRQEHAETLEIHYRVHTFALKRIRNLENRATSAEAVTEIVDIRNYLRLFLSHFFFANNKLPSNLPSIPVNFSFIRTMPPYGDFENKEAVLALWQDNFENVEGANDEETTLSFMTTFIDAQIECIELARFAYESIFRRFPHYKSIYRLAELQSLDKNYQGAVETIMRLYPSSGRMHFESVTEFHRTDFERSGSLIYHISKIIIFVTKCLTKYSDIDTQRITSVLLDIARYPDWQKVALSERTRNLAIKNCLAAFDKAIEASSKDNAKLTLIAKQLNKIFEEDSRITKALEINKYVEDAATRHAATVGAVSHKLFSSFIPTIKALGDKIGQYQRANVETSKTFEAANIARLREKEAQRQWEERKQQMQNQQMQQVLFAVFQQRYAEEQVAKQRQEEAARLQLAEKKRQEEEAKKLVLLRILQQQREDGEKERKKREAAEAVQAYAAQKTKQQGEEAEKQLAAQKREQEEVQRQTMLLALRKQREEAEIENKVREATIAAEKKRTQAKKQTAEAELIKRRNSKVQEEKFKKTQETLKIKRKKEADEKMRLLQQQADQIRKEKFASGLQNAARQQIEQNRKKQEQKTQDQRFFPSAAQRLNLLQGVSNQGAATDQFELLVRQQIELAEAERLKREHQRREMETQTKLNVATTPLSTASVMTASTMNGGRSPKSNSSPKKPRPNSANKKREREEKEEKVKQQQKQEEKIRNKILEPAIKLADAGDRKREAERVKRINEVAPPTQVKKVVKPNQCEANHLLLNIKITNFIDNNDQLSVDLKDEMRKYVNTIVKEIQENPMKENIMMNTVIKYAIICQNLIANRQRAKVAETTTAAKRINEVSASVSNGSPSVPGTFTSTPHSRNQVPTTSTLTLKPKSVPSPPVAIPPPPNQNLILYTDQPSSNDLLERQLMSNKLEKLLSKSLPMSMIAGMKLINRPLQYLKDTISFVEYGLSQSSSTLTTTTKTVVTSTKQAPTTSVSLTQVKGTSVAQTPTMSKSGTSVVTPTPFWSNSLQNSASMSTYSTPLNPTQRKRPANDYAPMNHVAKQPKVSLSTVLSSPQASRLTPTINGLNLPSTSTVFPRNFPSLAQQVTKAIPSKSDDDIVVLKEVKASQKTSSHTPSTNHVNSVIDSVLASSNANRLGPSKPLPSVSQPAAKPLIPTSPMVSQNVYGYTPASISTAPVSMYARGLPPNQPAPQPLQQTPPFVSAQNQNQRLPQQHLINTASMQMIMAQLANNQSQVALMQLVSTPGAIDKLPEHQRQQIIMFLQSQGANVR